MTGGGQAGVPAENIWRLSNGSMAIGLGASSYRRRLRLGGKKRIIQLLEKNKDHGLETYQAPGTW